MGMLDHTHTEWRSFSQTHFDAFVMFCTFKCICDETAFMCKLIFCMCCIVGNQSQPTLKQNRCVLSCTELQLVARWVKLVGEGRKRWLFKAGNCPSRVVRAVVTSIRHRHGLSGATRVLWP